MSVLTSKQIRRQIAITERAMFTPKLRRRKRALFVPDAATIEVTTVAHRRQIDEAIQSGNVWAAGFHAQEAVRYVRIARTAEIRRDYKVAEWKAADCARHELFNCSID